jgi:LPS-assembly lipoprotein
MALIRVMPIADRSGQELRNLLLSRLSPGGEPANYRYVLTVRLTESLGSMGFQKDASSTLGKLTTSAQFTLSDVGSEQPVGLSGSLVSESSFDYEGPRYGSVAMERDARTRVLTDLADRISNQVGGMLARLPPGQAK